MADFNVVATAQRGQEFRLLRLLRRFGDFTRSGFRDVVVGKVPSTERLLEELLLLHERTPSEVSSLSQVVPIKDTFIFKVDELLDGLKSALLGYIDELAGKRFYVRAIRRGHKGELSSLLIEQALDAFLKEELIKRGLKAEIDFKDPDVIVVVQTIGDIAGVGLITKEMKDRYPFIKIK